MAQEIVRISLGGICGTLWFVPCFYRLSAVSPSDRWFPFVSHFSFFLRSFRYGYSPSAPCPGRERLGCIGFSDMQHFPRRVVIHSGAATTEGDMSYLEEEFDPCRQDPRRNMPGVLDSNIDISQLNTINFNNIDQRTAQVAVVQQGVDPAPGEVN